MEVDVFFRCFNGYFDGVSVHFAKFVSDFSNDTAIIIDNITNKRSHKKHGIVFEVRGFQENAKYNNKNDGDVNQSKEVDR